MGKSSWFTVLTVNLPVYRSLQALNETLAAGSKEEGKAAVEKQVLFAKRTPDTKDVTTYPKIQDVA